MKSDNYTVSLVLGSGGARGLAHIGVIDWLTQHGIRIESISGSSMGALVGGIYAADQLDVYKNWVMALEKTDVLRLMDLSFSGAGLFKGERIIERLRELVGVREIKDLSIAYTAVATDVKRQKEVWINKGPLFDAIRASIAIPMVFTPFEIEGRRLLDGGIINPLPIAPTLTDNTDITIAVHLSGHSNSVVEHGKELPTGSAKGKLQDASYSERIKAFIRDLQNQTKPELQSDWDFREIMSMSFDTMQNTIARMKLAAYTPDYTVVIPRNAAGGFEYYRAQELIELGYQKAEAALQQLTDKDRQQRTKI